MDEQFDNENTVESPDNAAGEDQTQPQQSADVRESFTFGSILRDGFACFKTNFKMLLLLVLTVTLPMALVQVFMIDSRFDYGGTMDTFMQLYSESAESGETGDISGMAWKLALYLGISALIASVSLITNAGALILVGRRYGYVDDSGAAVRGTGTLRERDDIGFSALFEQAFRAFPKLWLTMLFVNFSVFMGFMLCFIPGILIYYVFQFSACSVVLTGLWCRRAGFVSSLATRMYPRPSLICALVFFVASGVLIPLLISLLAGLPALIGLDAVTSGIISVVLKCVQQLLVLLTVVTAATLFARMLPKLEPIIDNSGVRGDKTIR